MKRHFNFTDRKKLEKSCLSFETVDGPPRKIIITNLDFSSKNFPADAEVILEVRISGTSRTERFHVGTVEAAGRITHKEFVFSAEKSERFSLALKVIAPNDRKRSILGLAEGIKLAFGKERQRGTRSILSFSTDDLGDVLWKLEYESNEVVLVANSAIPNASSLFLENRYAPLLLPEIVRSVLTRALYERRGSLPEGKDDSDESWSTQWLLFAKGFSSDGDFPAVFTNGEYDFDAADEWIEEVIEAFCAKHNFKKRFGEVIELDEGEE